MDTLPVPDLDDPLAPMVIIVGFGLPGRFVAEMLDARKLRYTVIELNAANARGAVAGGKPMICGDARDPAILRQSGIEKAVFLTITLPDEKMVLEILHVARALNPHIIMLARCSYTSTGIRARKAGAADMVVEEQIVALEFTRMMGRNIEARAERGQGEGSPQ